MEFSRRNFLKVCGLGIGSGILAGCSSSTDTTVTSDTGPAEETEDSGEESSSSGSGKLTVWAWDQTFNILSMQIAADMYAEDHEGFEVEIVETSSDDCQTKLITCATSGDYSSMADIVLMQDNSFQKYLNAYPDAFTDITDCGINWDDFGSLKQSYSVKDGSHYGVPFDNGAVIGVYRNDYLTEAGYTLDDLTDITWSRFTEIGEDVYAKTGKYLLTSESTGGDTLMMMVQSCGANFVDDDGNAYIVGNEIAEKCIDLYIDMIEKNVVKLVNNWDEYIATITNGEAAGIVNGNWITATLMTTEDQSGLWEITTMPAVDDVSSATNYANNGGSSWYITANCSDVALAEDFLTTMFAQSTDFYDTILPQTGVIACYIPAGESEVYNEPNEFFNNQAIFATIVEYSTHIPEFPSNPYHYEARETINTAVVNIIDGADKETALQDAQDTLEFTMSG